jgi:hypothetical protein
MYICITSIICIHQKSTVQLKELIYQYIKFAIKITKDKLKIKNLT